MAKISRALALLLTFASSRAQFSPPGVTTFRKYTLDDIVPVTDQASGHVKCCPAGTEFDGKACVVNVPICPEGSTRDGDKCIVRTKPSCDAGYDYQSGFCITTKPPTCDHGTILKGNHCVLEGIANCEAGYTLQGNVCVAQKPPVCPMANFSTENHVPLIKGQNARMEQNSTMGYALTTKLHHVPKERLLTPLALDAFRSRCHAALKIPRFKTNNAFRLLDSYVVMVAFSILRLNLVLSMGSPSVLLELNWMIRSASMSVGWSVSRVRPFQSTRREALPAVAHLS